MKIYYSLILISFFSCVSLVARSETSVLEDNSFKDCSDCPEMVTIPPGRFSMGHYGGVSKERYEGPVRSISIDYVFALGKTEITNYQYQLFAEDTGYVSGTGCAIWDGKTFFHTEGKDWQDPGYGRAPLPEEPVVCVTWNDVKEYTNWLAKKTGKLYRLPSESEWEYASRAGTTGKFTWGNDPDGGCDVANIYDSSAFTPNRPWEPVKCDDGFSTVAPVASLKPNNFGLYDMSGNVWEWVQDCYIMPVPLFPRDGSAVESDITCDRRAVKGGGWSSPLSWQRPTFRGRDPLDRISHLFGFRVALDLVDR